MEFQELYQIACRTVNPRLLSPRAEAGSVAAALLTASGHVYTGVCLDMACSVGFCAEHAAAAAMITNGEQQITKIVAVNKRQEILPPCGRCREFLSQLAEKNLQAQVMVAKDRVVLLADLLPYDWKSIE